LQRCRLAGNIVYSPDGKTLAAWHDEWDKRFVRLWDAATGKELCRGAPGVSGTEAAKAALRRIGR